MESNISSKDLFAPFEFAEQPPLVPQTRPMEAVSNLVPEDDLNISMSSDEEAPCKVEEDKASATGRMKTTHEVDPDDYYNEATVPRAPQLGAADVLVPIGTVAATMPAKCLVTASVSIGVLDLDNVVFSHNRKCVGFVEDVLGPVDQPLYLIFFYPKSEGEHEAIEKGQNLYCPLKGIKLVVISALREHKGCDASNIYDEEISKDDVEYSDDEEERKAKRSKRKRPECNSVSEVAAGRESAQSESVSGRTRPRYSQRPQYRPRPPPIEYQPPMYQYPAPMMGNYQGMPPVQGMNTFGQYPPNPGMQYPFQHPYAQVPGPYYGPYSAQHVFQPPP